MENGSSPAAAVAAPPELDHPGTRPVSHGLSASASQLNGLNTPGLSGSPPAVLPAPIIVFVPTMTAPARRRRSTEMSSNRETTDCENWV